MSNRHRTTTWFGHRARDTFVARLTKAVQVSDTQLAITRIVIAFVLLFVAPLPHYGWLDNLPGDFFNPAAGLPQLVLALPFRLPLALLDWIIRILCLGLLLGIRAQLTGPFLSLALLYANSFRYSLGKIDHNDILLIITLASLSMGSGWGRRLAILPDPLSRPCQTSWGPKVLAVSIVVGMATAGCGKLLSWVDLKLDTSGFLSWYSSREQLHEIPQLGQWLGQLPPSLLEAIDYSTVLLELSPLLMILMGRRWWQGWLIAANIFHLGVYLSLKISFLYQSLTYLAFNSWTIQDKPPTALRKPATGLLLAAVVVIIVARHAVPAQSLRYGFTACGFIVILALQVRGVLIEERERSATNQQRG